MPDDELDEFEAGEEPPEPELDELPAEVPEADAVEQRQNVYADNLEPRSRDLPFDASEADVLEQRYDVPFDDDEGD